MTNFFNRLREFFLRLHVVLAIFILVFELVGYSYEFDTTSSFISTIFDIERYVAFFIIFGIILISQGLFYFLIGSFINEKEILLAQLKLENDANIVKYREDMRQKINEIKTRERKIFKIIINLLILIGFILLVLKLSG